LYLFTTTTTTTPVRFVVGGEGSKEEGKGTHHVQGGRGEAVYNTPWDHTHPFLTPGTRPWLRRDPSKRKGRGEVEVRKRKRWTTGKTDDRLQTNPTVQGGVHDADPRGWRSIPNVNATKERKRNTGRVE